MNSKECAKLAFGNPGFFDFLAPVTNFLKPVSAPLVKASSTLSGAILDRITGSNLPSQAIARPEVQTLGQNLFSVGVLSGGAIAAGAVAAPLIAGASLPSLGSLGSLGSISALGSLVQDNPDVTDSILSDDESESADDDNDPGGEED